MNQWMSVKFFTYSSPIFKDMQSQRVWNRNELELFTLLLTVDAANTNTLVCSLVSWCVHWYHDVFTGTLVCLQTPWCVHGTVMCSLAPWYIHWHPGVLVSLWWVYWHPGIFTVTLMCSLASWYIHWHPGVLVAICYVHWFSCWPDCCSSLLYILPFGSCRGFD